MTNFNTKLFLAEQIRFIDQLLSELPASEPLNQDEPADWDKPFPESEVKRLKLEKMRTYFIAEFTDGIRTFLLPNELDEYTELETL